jgi:hypothetical protein
LFVRRFAAEARLCSGIRGERASLFLGP